MFVAYCIVAGLLALVLLGSATAKLRGVAQVVETMDRIEVPHDWHPRLALAEVAGGLGLIVGMFVAPIGVLAALGVIAYFVGAVIFHVRAHDSDLVAPIVLALVAAAALVLRVASM